jgi:hypothetical protein
MPVPEISILLMQRYPGLTVREYTRGHGRRMLYMYVSALQAIGLVSVTIPAIYIRTPEYGQRSDTSWILWLMGNDKFSQQEAY